MTVAPEIFSVNPATEEVLERFSLMTEGEVTAAVESSHAAAMVLRSGAVRDRQRNLAALAEQLRRTRDKIAAVITAEMGKPIAEAIAEVDKSALCCEYYAEHGPSFLAEERIASDTPNSYVAFRPLGVILAVMPWNFPLWQVIRALAPALMAGNSLLLKHAANVTRCALLIEDAVRQAGFPEGGCRVLRMQNDDVDRLIGDPRIRGVTLTGSDRAGAAVGAAAGAAVKKCVLELGGSDAFIVLEDADVDEAARVGVRARFQNCGQSCIAAKRFIVVDAVADRFTERFVEAAKSLVVGDPTDSRTTMGPLARADLRENLEKQLARSLDSGARLVIGGKRAGTRGFFFEPTVIDRHTAATPAFREETFGPLAAIARVADCAEAVRLANDSPYGLGGAVWTGDPARGEAVARELDTGGVFVNGMTHSDPRLPFGGVKQSGYGRELGLWGIREFTNAQTVWVP